MIHYCFKQGCKLKAQYLCLCLSSETYCCEFHLESHLKLPNRAHTFDSVLTKPSEWTKDEVFGILTEEKSKKEKLKQIVFAFISQNAQKSKENFEERLRMINSDLKEIQGLIEKIFQIPELSNELFLKPNTEKLKMIILKGSELYTSIKLFYRLNKLRYSTSSILNRTDNDSETELYFRKTCKKYENFVSSPLLNHAYQELISAYEKLTSHYFFQEYKFFIYNTEREKEEILKTPNLSESICIAKLPNGELFCLSKDFDCMHALIINKYYEPRILPSEGLILHNSLAIYFDKSVYFFGGINFADTRRFDLNTNRWIKLKPIPTPLHLLNIIIFNRNILISQPKGHLWTYSVDIDSYLEIPYTFSDSWGQLLIAGGEKIFLIDWDHEIIYESEDEFSWTKTVSLRIKIYPNHAYYSYNKGGIYISAIKSIDRHYLKFDLDKKALIDRAYFNYEIALKMIDDKLEEINYRNRIFKVDPEQFAVYFNKGYSLYNFSQVPSMIESLKTKIKDNPNDNHALSYTRIGCALKYLDNQKAIKYFNKALGLDPNNSEAYFEKGYTLHNLNRNFEALECYNEAIKQETFGFLYVCHRANLLNYMGQEAESFKDFKLAFNMAAVGYTKFISDNHLNHELLINQLDLLRTLYNFQKRALKFKGEFQKIKETTNNNPEIINNIEVKEKEHRKQHSNLLEIAVFWLTEGSKDSIWNMQLITNDINEFLKASSLSVRNLKKQIRKNLSLS